MTRTLVAAALPHAAAPPLPEAVVGRSVARARTVSRAGRRSRDRKVKPAASMQRM
jgi:hypothetical protein